MVTGARMKEILLHGAADEAFDRSVEFARALAETSKARLHVMYTIENPLSAGWTAEMAAERLPELHQGMEAEARERLAMLIPMEEQDRLNVEIVLRTGPAAEELVQYTMDHPIDLAIVHARASGGSGSSAARALFDGGRCAVLVLR